ncbi:PREDICTED: set1/Ash2 histone methyltransferase complex subunit ASH2-like [Priapulus caudatus]|uniref:Set1/Ash2 histone methyltransferase complex subunit ASH2-like n=1 Tax=Priapulus caudatus TaxID=37621 RepID=A0ABM1EHE5_PRICU|nr:PREDICTED: set1/Ash2 histone methyltransferase complex subunit ASH2-like [Priapulus caudatus]
MQQGGGGAGACRRRTTVGEGVAVATTRKTRSEPAAKLPAHGYPTEHPFNKDGYRYILADADPHAPNRQEFDDSQECAGRPIPSYFYRGAVLPRVILAPNDRAAQLKLSDDRMTVTGEKGYCLIRASHCVRSGGWYYEFTVDDMPPETACRVGWAQAYENLQAPCGYDKFSYSWRSRKGTRFHNSRGRHYSAAYGEGDVLGCYIYLPELRDPSALVPDTVKDKPLVKFKNYLYYEDQLETQQVLKSLRPARGSRVVFYKNGRCQGTAFVDVHAGCYYPAVSLYRGCTVTVNFGPSFRCPPRDGVRYRPVSECATETIAQQTLSDLLFFVENEGKLTLEL